MNFGLSFKHISNLTNLGSFRKTAPLTPQEDRLTSMGETMEMVAVQEKLMYQTKYRNSLISKIYQNLGTLDAYLPSNVKFGLQSQINFATIEQLEELAKLTKQEILESLQINVPETPLTKNQIAINLAELDQEAAQILVMELEAKLAVIDNLMRNLSLAKSADDYSNKFRQLAGILEDMGVEFDLEQSLDSLIEYAALLRNDIKSDKQSGRVFAKPWTDEDYARKMQIGVYCFVLNLFMEVMTDSITKVQESSDSGRLASGVLALQAKRDRFLGKYDSEDNDMSDYQYSASWMLQNIRKNIAAGRDQYATVEMRALADTESEA